jgi:hypothetical protein
MGLKSYAPMRSALTGATALLHLSVKAWMYFGTFHLMPRSLSRNQRGNIRTTCCQG